MIEDWQPAKAEKVRQQAITLCEALFRIFVRITDDAIPDEVDVQLFNAAEDCAWFFLDTSKNHTRRWCDMKTCGNRVKVSRHYERKKQDVRKG